MDENVSEKPKAQPSLVEQAQRQLGALKDALAKKEDKETVMKSAKEAQKTLEAMRDDVTGTTRDKWQVLQEQLDHALILAEGVGEGIRQEVQQRIENLQSLYHERTAEILKKVDQNDWIGAATASLETSVDTLATGLFGQKPGVMQRVGEWFRNAAKSLPDMLRREWHKFWAGMAGPDGQPTFLAAILGIDVAYHRQSLESLQLIDVLRPLVADANKQRSDARTHLQLPNDWFVNATAETKLRTAYAPRASRQSFQDFIKECFLAAAPDMPGGEVTISRIVSVLNERHSSLLVAPPAPAAPAAPAAPPVTPPPSA